MNATLAERNADGRPHDSIPAVTAACDLMESDWSPWHMVLYGLTWDDYERLLEAREAAGRKRLRITYDRGTAELYTPGGDSVLVEDQFATTDLNGDPVMSIGNRHERWKKLIARLFEAAAMGFRTAVVACGNLTLSRADLDRALEPDECYYVQNAATVSDVRELDFATDPPPDLFIEIEVSRTVMDRLELCGKMKIPEVWRYDGATFRILVRSGNTYIEALTSLAFPKLTANVLSGYLARQGSVDDTTLCNEILEWARSQS